MKKILQFILLISLSFSLIGCVKLPFIQKVDQNINSDIEVNDQVEAGEVAVIEGDIIVTKPLSNEVISSPLEITGRAKISQGAVLFRLKDALEGVIATSTAAVALGDTTEWGFYSGQLNFNSPIVPFGWLEVYTKNSEDGSEQDLIRLQTEFKEYKKPIVKVYFNNIKNDPGMPDCSKVYPVEREIDLKIVPNALEKGALEELLAGLTNKDKDNGFVSNLPTEGVKVQKLEVKDGTANVDFNQALQQGVAGSCRVIAIRAQITQTLRQFPGINNVVISIDGKTEEILQP